MGGEEEPSIDLTTAIITVLVIAAVVFFIFFVGRQYIVSAFEHIKNSANGIIKF